MYLTAAAECVVHDKRMRVTKSYTCSAVLHYIDEASQEKKPGILTLARPPTVKNGYQAAAAPPAQFFHTRHYVFMKEVHTKKKN